MKHVPLNLRQILSAESAANDGLGMFCCVTGF